MNYSALKFWFTVCHSVITGLVCLYVWMSNRRKAANSRIDKLEEAVHERLDGHACRLTAVEGEMKHLPSHKDITELGDKLSERIEEIRKEVSEMSGALGGIKRAVDLINQHLLSQGSGK